MTDTIYLDDESTGETVEFTGPTLEDAIRQANEYAAQSENA